MKELYLKETDTYYKTGNLIEGRLTLIFIHGLTGSSSAWWPYEKIFEKKHNVVIYDIRGHGKSKRFKDSKDYEIRKFAEDLHKIILFLNISRVVLVAHSFGTLIALEYIKLYGESIVANVLLAPIFNPQKRRLKKFLRQILGMSSIFNLLPFNPKIGRHIDYAKYVPTTDWEIRRLYVDISNTTLRTYLFCLKHAMNSEQEYFLEKIKIPTLLIHGLNDTLAGADNSVTLSKIIEKSELMLIPNENHFAVLNSVQKISNAIESFIEKQE